MARLGVDEDRVKQAGARVVEKVGRLKLNGQLLGYSSLSRLVELEAMMLGVTGKRGLWLALNESYGQDPRPEGVDLRGCTSGRTASAPSSSGCDANAARDGRWSRNDVSANSRCTGTRNAGTAKSARSRLSNKAHRTRPAGSRRAT